MGIPFMKRFIILIILLISGCNEALEPEIESDRYTLTYDIHHPWNTVQQSFTRVGEDYFGGFSDSERRREYIFEVRGKRFWCSQFQQIWSCHLFSNPQFYAIDTLFKDGFTGCQNTSIKEPGSLHHLLFFHLFEAQDAVIEQCFENGIPLSSKIISSSGQNTDLPQVIELNSSSLPEDFQKIPTNFILEDVTCLQDSANITVVSLYDKEMKVNIRSGIDSIDKKINFSFFQRKDFLVGIRGIQKNPIRICIDDNCARYDCILN